MRVALRRLRAAISLFSVVVGDDRASAIKTELRWLAQELGPARDLDTLLFEVIKPLRKRHANEPGLASIGNMFARKRLKSYRRGHEAVQSARSRRLAPTADRIETGSWYTSEDPVTDAGNADRDLCRRTATQRRKRSGDGARIE
jgi:CHAD domain-containing protein